MRISGNKFLITGASDGIGKAMALALADKGNTIIAIGRNRERLEQLSIRHYAIVPFCADLSLQQDIDGLIRFIHAQHADLNVLINNAGIQYNYFWGTEAPGAVQIEEELKVNLSAPLQLCAGLYPLLLKQEESAIVNVSSALAVVPKADAAVYAATKAALRMFSQSLRLQDQKVRVFELVPPLVDTAMTKGRGKGKMQAEELAALFIRLFEKDVFEMNVGKVKLLKLVHRVFPALALRIVNR
ncbi:SDR family oxidoreductase [Parasegetibacter sp. NRK P23]|uniref:SDR family oxidoreductase n=1 Tax=Parasegetibacter sp. NRK P23 TaxID=2942999 RepID=UPI0020447DCD|nr:SDR family NAD(P)-dependent oxidoreductase [Parasegetibacter sp. NRK P23]MCM5529090.1 SDR family NAD(P)-dependent oxidoreductase [Parasegetibacter sp. NRK P23]